MRVLSSLLKALRPAPPKPAPPKVAGLFAPAYGPAAGWWQSDPAEQLRNYRSWVYAAVNAIAQEAAKHRPQLYLNTGPADHDLKTLPHTHPLARLLDRPNPWLTPWELWYLTVVYLELTGNCFCYQWPQDRHRASSNRPQRRSAQEPTADPGRESSPWPSGRGCGA